MERGDLAPLSQRRDMSRRPKAPSCRAHSTGRGTTGRWFGGSVAATRC